MKKILFFLSLFALCCSINSCGAEPATTVAPTSTATGNYVMYPTVNIYTFLKLDTRNGRIWQVQYSLDENEFEVALSEEFLANGDAGRFALYPTTNNWTFLLLDTELGNVYHVQWSQDADKRIVYKIPSL